MTQTQKQILLCQCNGIAILKETIYNLQTLIWQQIFPQRLDFLGFSFQFDHSLSPRDTKQIVLEQFSESGLHIYSIGQKSDVEGNIICLNARLMSVPLLSLILCTFSVNLPFADILLNLENHVLASAHKIQCTVSISIYNIQRRKHMTCSQSTLNTPVPRQTWYYQVLVISECQQLMS